MAVNGECPGNDDLAKAVAAHFLNPSLKSPITVGIAAECGSGGEVPSFMKKIERHLLLTASQAAFPLKDFNEEQQLLRDQGKTMQLSEKGKRIEHGVTKLLHRQNREKNKEDALHHFLEEYQNENEAIYKYLACVDLNQLVRDPEDGRNGNLLGTTRILTLNFSAEDYRENHEACDDLVVEISKAIEKSMTAAQRWTTRNKHNKEKLYTTLDWLLPALVFGVIYVAWMFIERFNATKLKFGTIPAFVLAFAATALKKTFDFSNSSQVSDFLKKHLHSQKTEQYGYQETVIQKIKFLKKESGVKPSPIFSFFTGANLEHWWSRCLGRLVPKKIKVAHVIPQYGSAPPEKLRIIAFMSGLDRYQDSVIVKVLQSLNTVLKACEINFVLALDKNIIRKAFKTRADDADHIISQIIQLPLTLVQSTVHENSEKQENNKNDIEKQLQCPCGRKKYVKCRSGIESFLGERVAKVREMSEKQYSPNETATFQRLNGFGREVSGLQQNYVKYHSFARNVISYIMDPATQISSDWDKELVAWIFICSQWRPEMNILIERWHAYVDEDDNSIEPSLKDIVDRYIKEQEKQKNAADSFKEFVARAIKEHFGFEGKQKTAADSFHEIVVRAMKEKDKINAADSMVEEEKEKETKLNSDLYRWTSLQKALQVQDVSMNAIQRFQSFRFHCDAGYLNCPS